LSLINVGKIRGLKRGIGGKDEKDGK